MLKTGSLPELCEWLDWLICGFMESDNDFFEYDVDIKEGQIYGLKNLEDEGKKLYVRIIATLTFDNPSGLNEIKKEIMMDCHSYDFLKNDKKIIVGTGYTNHLFICNSNPVINITHKIVTPTLNNDEFLHYARCYEIRRRKKKNV